MTRRRIYLCAALYAEGTSDYEFLSPLIQRLLDVLGSRLFPGMVDVGETIGIDAPKPIPSKRAERIAAAVADHWNAFTLLVVHADGGGAPDEARQNNVFPGIELARRAFPSLIAIPCVPVREIEAWMLADDNVFKTLLGREAAVSLPADPTREMDPKQLLQRIFQDGGLRRGNTRAHRLFGEEVRFEVLRKLVAFQQFEAELCTAIQSVANATD
jgi:Domain of unknown function (DUF4276)